jgi:hypothetical protein
MKKWIWFVMFLMIGLLFIAWIPVPLEEGQKIVWTNLLKLVGDIVLAILGIYEVLARLFPTINDITIIGNIIKILKWLSDILNKRNDVKTIKTEISGKSFVTTKSE